MAPSIGPTKVNFLALIASSFFAYTNAATASAPVTIGLRTSWPAHNLLLEILETAAHEKPSSFFPLFDALTSSESFPTPLASMTPEAIHQASLTILEAQDYFALSIASNDTKPNFSSSLKLFDLALALHVSSPKLEAYYQFYNSKHLDRVAVPSGYLVEECGSWIDWYGARLCSSDDLLGVLGREALEDKTKTASKPKPTLLPFDHILPSQAETVFTPPVTAILYADISSSNLRELHETLRDAATAMPPKVRYVLRWIPPADLREPPKKVSERNDELEVKHEPVKPKRQYLTGYGVGLDLKKMDYLALDDRRSKHGQSKQAKDASAAQAEDAVEVDFIREILDALPPPKSANGEPINLSTPLTKEEFQYLGVQAAQLILSSPQPFKALEQLSSNFPRYATQLARSLDIDGDLQYEMAFVSKRLPKTSDMNMLWINGKVFDGMMGDEFSPFGILPLLRSERKIMESLASVGLSPLQAMDVLTAKGVHESLSEGDALDGIFDASDRQENGDVIIWLNDLEKDARYKDFPTTIESITTPIYPGSFHSLGINLFNNILAVDLSKRESLIWIFRHVSNIIERKFPFRWGIVPLLDTPEAQKAARLFYYVYKHYGPKETMDFVRSLIAAQPTGDTLDFLIANAFFNNLALNVKPLLKLELDPSVSHDFDIVAEGAEQHSKEQLLKATKWAERLDLTIAGAKGAFGHVFFNGRYYLLDGNYLMNLQRDAGAQTVFLSGEVLAGKLSNAIQETIDISTYFYDLPTTPKRRNRYLFPDASTSPLRVQSVDVMFGDKEKWSQGLVYPAESDPAVPVTVTAWVIGDLDDPQAIDLAVEALMALSKQKEFRLGFVHAPRSLPNSDATATRRVSTLLQQIFAGGSTQGSTISAETLLEKLTAGAPDPVNSVEYLKYCLAGQRLARDISFKPGDMGLIVNGRIIGPIPNGSFYAEDIVSLVAYEKQRRVLPLLDALNEAGLTPSIMDRTSYADLTAVAASIVAAVHAPDPKAEGLYKMTLRARQRGYRQLDVRFSKFTHGEEKSAYYHIAVILDPVSETAQKWSSLLNWLSTLDEVFLEIYFVTDQTREELPLKRFYRSLLKHRLQFDQAGEETAELIRFEGLPEEPIYTLAMDVPSSWLVRPRESEHDLDNIHLASLSAEERNEGVKALFDLDFLVIEGHARDMSTGGPARGLQLRLTTSDMVPVADTLVMENLGYLQFKSKPGVFQLEIMKGRGEDVFVTESVGNEGWNSPPVDGEAGAQVTLTSFEGLTMYPRFKRQSGKGDADVLAPPKEGFLSSAVQKVVSVVSSWIQPPEEVPEADINIFTVASGHLYERFASIMILSVMKNTNSTVKFWFIENFLSPSFLEFIPHLAEEYDFQYELVTYKWPSWLRSQREKQRVIWGYKILFLDVLFPMDLKKVIFVDADQIVRTDLQELVDLDLHGAPYGYTPMGDDNTDMEGFRFWKTGYWKDYLKGRPYHISALYVIDLVRFRQLAAGDRLRGHYQQLSVDPNSLANLDQDLPNNMQFEVPIYSLDKDWLWCETWCSKDRLDKAKTIDLCQNPLTKEPKLSRARQIPEWSQYDAEIATFARRLVKEGKIESSALGAEVDALAGEKPAAAAAKGEEVPKANEDASTGSSSTHDEL